MPERGRTPLRSKKLLDSLAQAGTAGCTTVQLAREVYKNTSYVAQGRVTQLVQGLRRRGHTILMVKDEGFLAGRYVLKTGG